MTSDQDANTQPPSRVRIGSLLKASILTAVPFVVLFIVIMSTVGRGAELVWALGLGLCILALLTSAGFAIADRRRIALGILAGTGIGVVGLVVSCSTVLAAAA